MMYLFYWKLWKYYPVYSVPQGNALYDYVLDLFHCTSSKQTFHSSHKCSRFS